MNSALPRTPRVLLATAVLVLGLITVVGVGGAEAATSPFCKKKNFTQYHYTSTNPHVDHWRYVTHYSTIPFEHYHVWDGYPEHGVYTTPRNLCQQEPGF